MFLVSFCKLFRLYFLHLDQLSVEAWTCRLSSNPPPEQSLPCPLSQHQKRNVHIFSTQSLAQTWNQTASMSTTKTNRCPMCKPLLHWRKPKWLKPLWNSPLLLWLAAAGVIEIKKRRRKESMMVGMRMTCWCNCSAVCLTVIWIVK